MTTLADLFPGSDAPRDDDGVRPDGSHRLGLLVGGPRPVTAVRDRQATDDTANLRALVGGRIPAIAVVSGSATTSAPRRRARGRRDKLSTFFAVLAVGAVVVAGVVVGTALASASPSAGAVQTLTESEGLLVDRIAVVNAGIAAVEATRADDLAHASALGAALASVGDASEPSAWTAAETARQQFVAALTAVQPPASASAYRRAALDESSLTEVGAAIDDVTARTTALTSSSDALAGARDQIDAAENAFATAMAAFTATIPTSAASEVKANADARAALRTATTSAADAVAAADLTNAAGLAALDGYANAVAALREGQTLAEEEAADAARDRPRSSTGATGSTSPPTPAPSESAPPPETIEPPSDGSVVTG